MAVDALFPHTIVVFAIPAASLLLFPLSIR